MTTRRAAGLTLIELMVALAVVSVLGILSYRAVAAATESRDRLNGEYQRWADISRFVQMSENDLLQMAARPPSNNAAAVSLVLTPIDNSGGVEISFIKLDGARATARRIGYRFDGTGTEIALLRWPGTDAVSLPTRDVVLDRVKAVRFACIFNNGQRTTVWPTQPQGITPAAAVMPLPDAVDMELELADVGTIRRLFALR